MPGGRRQLAAVGLRCYGIGNYGGSGCRAAGSRAGTAAAVQAGGGRRRVCSYRIISVILEGMAGFG